MIKFEDGEISWFKRLVDKELWLYRSANTGFHALSTLFDRRKWNKRKSTVEEGSKSLAVNLLKMMAIRNSLHRTPCSRQPELYAEFERNFTYTPTVDQLVCFADIERDMVNNTRPMDRLICGDVGFGKTEVAMRGTPLFLFLSALIFFTLSHLSKLFTTFEAIYRAVLSGRQVALLAPTRVLALQHLRVLKTRMPQVNVQLLRGGGKGDALGVKKSLKSGDCQVVVGTHALLSPSVSFDNLGLLIIDEEQRFGVAHKEKVQLITIHI